MPPFLRRRLLAFYQTRGPQTWRRIRLALENKLVSQRLRDLGYTKEEVTACLSEMSDNQIHKVAQKLDQVKVGGELGTVIVVLVVAIIVLLALHLAH